ncbi:Piso0_000993 [Millerozyma farinosa CBS 7064]|uniref:asparaginase n=1 Tax=Pichia sorbitophila (strain ATCC MYA-4447 / BCRC 22081 / CBS 7064 / NBRC 10061 / NRRL Y-12695) TaxID=559304 RepID=G8YQM2_PICSO|nr:Piso0_000993 [Millerozyma farinosa CBS 7064]CCE78957.1 Piso0_000993 [Millerozyma farinosa CBS 7064]
MDSGAVYDIVAEDTRDISHQSFAVKYRSNSNISDKELPDLNNLPTIKVLGTGGTIASKGTSGHQTAGYKVDLTIENLLDGIPDLSRTCNLNYEQVLNLDSKEIGTSELLILYEKVKEDIKKYNGIVITHGTDTMEETAFFLQSTIETDKPIVLCGSMRPSTAISSDGPMNLYQAIVIAAHRESRGRGVLVALNDRIGTGFYITKSNANSLDTFKSIGQGYIGNFVNNEVHYYFPPAKPLGIVYFNLPPKINPSSWPEIPILYAHQGFNNKLIELTIHGLEAKGLVLATMGAGSMAEKTNEFIAKFLKDHEDFPVIYSKRSMDGMVPNGSLPSSVNVNNEPVSFGNAIASGYLNPQKCRILLQLCIYSGFSVSQIKKIFRGLYGG